jgi:hypothetical protein
MNLVFMLLDDFQFFCVCLHSFLIRISFVISTIIAENGKGLLSLFIVVFLLILMHILVPFIEISLILICDKIANRATSIVSFTNSRSSIVSRHPEAFSLKLGISHHFLSQSLKSFVPQFLSPSITSIIS